MGQSRALTVEEVSVGAERLSCVVRVASDAPLRTSELPHVADSVLALLPGIVRHRCECGSAHGIIAELADTELPHLLEHVTLELMALAGSPRSLRGETMWDFAADGHGVFRISLEYDDDLVALGALSEAARIVDALVSGEGDGLDMDSITARVSAARGARRPLSPQVATRPATRPAD
ncbi:MAG: cyanophycin synthetase family protein [Anaerosomatales bacterium]